MINFILVIVHFLYQISSNVNLLVLQNAMKEVKGPGKFYARECDITKEESVIESLNWVKSTFNSLNILINNAGAITHHKIEGA